MEPGLKISTKLKTNPKNHTSQYSKDILHSESLAYTKDKLDLLSPEKIIDDILKNSKLNSKTSDNRKFDNRDAYLEDLKITSIANFLETIKHKSTKEIEHEFEIRIEEFSMAAKMYRDKKDKEILECKNALEISNMKIKEIEMSKVNLNERNRKLEEDKKEKEELIFKLQTKFALFEKLKPTFEEFFKEYPNEDPKRIIEDIKQKREGSVRIMEEVTQMRDRIFQFQKEKSEIIEKNRKIVQELSEKLSQAELINKDKLEKYIDDIHSLKTELSGAAVHREENIKLQKMLFHIYNKLVQRLALDKNITLDPSLNVLEKDFKPNLFDNAELAQYISTMLSNSHDEWSAKMLRETIAYANMMVRLYLKDKINKRFDPVSTFRDIKELLDNFINKKKEFVKELEILKEKNKTLETEIKKFEKEIKHGRIQYENLEKRFAEQFTKKLEKSKMLRASQVGKRKTFISENGEGVNHNMETGNPPNLTNLNEMGSQEMNGEFNCNCNCNCNKKNKLNNFDKKRSSSAKPGNFNKFQEKNENNPGPVFITNKKSLVNNRDLRSASTKYGSRPDTAALERNLPMEENNNFKNNNIGVFRPSTGRPYNKPYQTTENFYNPDQRIISEHNNQLEAINKIDNSLNFKHMKISKNKDKIHKTAVYKNFAINSEDFQSLVHHTNKMFLYNAKIKSETEKNIFKKFQNNMNTNFKKIDRIKKLSDGHEYEIGNKIIGNINGLIKNLEKKD